MNHVLIESFFHEYEARFNNSLATPPQENAEATAAAFAEFFVEATPAGIHGSPNDDAFLKAIPRSNEFYRSIGATSIEIETLDIIELNPLHAAVKVKWDSRYRKNGEAISIPFEVIYLVQVNAAVVKIFAYITGDEQKALEDQNLLA